MGLENLGKLLVGIGVLLVAVGGLLAILGKAGWLGGLPGDFRIQRDGFTLYLPLATSILLSLILTLLFNLIFRGR